MHDVDALGSMVCLCCDVMAGYKRMCCQGTCGSARERCYAASGGTLSPSRTLPIKTLTRKLLVLVSEV